jgi:hypothetical protein
MYDHSYMRSSYLISLIVLFRNARTFVRAFLLFYFCNCFIPECTYDHSYVCSAIIFFGSVICLTSQMHVRPLVHAFGGQLMTTVKK